MAKLQCSKGRYWLTIPLEKIKVKGWQKGDEFSLDFNKEGQLVITRINNGRM